VVSKLVYCLKEGLQGGLLFKGGFAREPWFPAA